LWHVLPPCSDSIAVTTNPIGSRARHPPGSTALYGRKRYPHARAVRMCRGLAGSSSSFRRSRAICVSTARRLTAALAPHTSRSNSIRDAIAPRRRISARRSRNSVPVTRTGCPPRSTVCVAGSRRTLPKRIVPASPVAAPAGRPRVLRSSSSTRAINSRTTEASGCPAPFGSPRPTRPASVLSTGSGVET
jgi:hypothetical protein